MKKRTIVLILIFALGGLVTTICTAALKPQVKVGKILSLETLKSADQNTERQYAATILLCNNKKVKKYLIGQQSLWQLDVNKIIKFQVKSVGSKVMKKLIE